MSIAASCCDLFMRERRSEKRSLSFVVFFFVKILKIFSAYCWENKPAHRLNISCGIRLTFYVNKFHMDKVPNTMTMLYSSTPGINRTRVVMPISKQLYERRLSVSRLLIPTNFLYCSVSLCWQNHLATLLTEPSLQSLLSPLLHKVTYVSNSVMDIQKQDVRITRRIYVNWWTRCFDKLSSSFKKLGHA